MEHKAAKLGTTFAAAVLGLGLPAIASAQEMPAEEPQAVDPSVVSSSQIEAANAPELPTISAAVADMGAEAQMLSNLGTISADDVAMISLSDIGVGADQRYTLMQSMDPSQATALQQALQNVYVAEGGLLAGYQRSLANHLRLMSVDPASVVAVNVGDDGSVTVYYQ